MEVSLIYICLTVLALIVALNLKLTLHLFELIRNPALLNPPFLPTEVGELMPDVTGKVQYKQSMSLTATKQATVLLFLSSRCPKCQQKLSEIEALLPLLDEAGLHLLLVSYEPKRHFAKFLKGGPLLDYVWQVNHKQYKLINPTQSTPYYLFVNHLTELEAGGVIGDEDWLSFLQQMDEIRQQEAVA